jgi:quinoprotein glucose dehydrogenase
MKTPLPRLYSAPSFLLGSAFFFAASASIAQPAADAIEDRVAREKLPLYQIIPAATPDELTPTNGLPDPAKMTTWTVSHGDAGSTRYSALKQINKSNVHLLKEAWTYHSKDGARNIQANPIVVDGVLYGPTAGRAIVALDAAKGTELWRYQVETPERPGLEDAPARRGLVYWPGDDTTSPRIVFASGRWLYVLDPKTGKPIESFGEKGRTPFPTGGTAVGCLWQGHYIVPGLWGDVYSFNLKTGALVWRFRTIPIGDEFGADTWVGSAREGAHPWGGMALDEARGIAYIAAGAARPDFIGVDRLGDNLFSNCLIALDARTGKRLWHFQNVRHDLWDLDNPAPPNLLTITLDGRRIDVVACLTKEGGTLLLDRVSGKPIFPFRLRRAPTSTLPGEVTAPYQPYPELPEPLVGPEVNLSEITDRTPEAHEFVMRQVKRATYGWYEPPTLGVQMLYQSSRGGPEWTGGSVDLPTGRLYVSTNHLLSHATVYPLDERERDPKLPPSAGEKIYAQYCGACHGPKREGMGMVPSLYGLRKRMTDAEVISLMATGRNGMPPTPPMPDADRAALLDFLMRRNQPPPAPLKNADAKYFAVGYKFITDNEGYPGSKAPWGMLQCLDLNTGKILWRVPLGEYPELTEQGVPKTGTQNFGGPTVTAGGLVFCAGTRDELIRAFDADTGAELWSAKLPVGGYAPPTVYEVDGRQYVVIAATGGGKMGTEEGDAYVAFALPPP